VPLLSVRGLCVDFMSEDGVHRALFGISFSIEPGQVLGIVGESGSGKSVCAMALLRLLSEPSAFIAKGEALFRDEESGNTIDLLQLSEDELSKLRGNKIAFVFQDPMTALNPYLSIGEQLREVLVHHLRMDKKEAAEKCEAMLDAVKMPDSRGKMNCYPHELSGGMRQRVLIAAALLCGPALLIADEPTTALDVSVQASVLKVLNERVLESGAAMLIITHDLGVIANTSDRVAVMYAGRIVEEGPVEDIFRNARHPYTIALARSRPSLEGKGDDELVPIMGMPPRLGEIPSGCPFHPRCSYAADRCKEEEPRLRAALQFEEIYKNPAELQSKRSLHLVRCHFDELEVRS
jgi:oligopeptide transport system ATP-binding protein